jgi:hypothetical protein
VGHLHLEDEPFNNYFVGHDCLQGGGLRAAELAAAVEAAVAIVIREAVLIAAAAASNLAQTFDKLGSAGRAITFVLGNFLLARLLTAE